MIIYPKTFEDLNGLEYLKEYVEKNKGIEIQLLNLEETQKKTYEAIKSLKTEIPQLNEVTIHLPLKEEFNFEILTYSNLDVEKERLKKLIDISKEFNIRINILYHTRWNYISWNSSGAMDRMKELLDLVQNTNVNILIENIFSMVERKECAVLKVAKEINNKHLKVCLDICHLHVEANIFKIPFFEFLNTYLNKEECQKYIQQTHFAGTLNDDGYIEVKKTHGRVHDSWESFEKDYNILKQLGIEDKIIVTEISEDDYSTRKDEIEKIKMLLEIQ